MESIDKLLETLEKLEASIHDAKQSFLYLENEVEASIYEARQNLYAIYKEVGYTTIEEYSEKRNVTLTLQQLRWVINMATEICKEQEEPERLIPIAGRGLHYLFPEYVLEEAFEGCVRDYNANDELNDQIHEYFNKECR